MTSNNDRFVRIDEQEIRFFVRKIGKPVFHNHDIESNLRDEVPAFLHKLDQRTQIDWSVDRSGFTPAELENDSLRAVKENSKSWLYQEMKGYITDLFDNNNIKAFMASPIDLKNKWFANNQNVTHKYLLTTLREEFELEAMGVCRYASFGDTDLVQKVGRPYLFRREMFTADSITDEIPF
jgi:hypothetical protein